MFKVRIRSQIVSLCAFREAVRYGAGFCAFNGIEEQPVLLPETERTDCSFGGRVVDRNISVSQEDFELRLVVQAVIQAFCRFPFGKAPAGT